MAETAALNGFNRILGELNDNNNESYKGYLYTLDHHEGDPENPGTEKWGWKSVNQQGFPLKELCTDRSQAIQAVPSDGSTEGAPLVDLTDGATSQRSDGKANIKLQYRLRGYYSPGIDGFGEGSFQVEGVVLREAHIDHVELRQQVHLFAPGDGHFGTGVQEYTQQEDRQQSGESQKCANIVIEFLR